MEARNYPVWRDFDIPQGIVNAVKNTGNTNLIGFLLNDRVFRSENKINYEYQCFRCGHSKIVTRQYEDYSSCEKCRCESVHGIPFWKECRGSNKSISNLEASRIITQMEVNYARYFGSRLDSNLQIATVRWDDGYFIAKFVCGDEVKDFAPVSAVAKAAILCPFLWDSNFNWRDMIKNDRGNDLHISHLIMQWTI